MLKKSNVIKKITTTLALAALVFTVACSENEEMIRLKLDIILKSDLEAILEDVYEGALLEEPYFELLEYRFYDEGIFSRMAIADFFFLQPFDGKIAKITRKYRYHKRMGLWDRYYNRYYIVHVGNDGAEIENDGIEIGNDETETD